MSQQHIDLWQQTAEAFGQRLEAMGADQMAADSPCDGWCVEEVVNHALGTQVGLVGPLVGAEVPEGADWPTAMAAISQAMQAEGALEGMANGPFGEMPKTVSLGIGIADLLVHTWDVSRAAGLDETLPAAAVSASWAGMQRMPEEALRSEGMFGPAIEAPEGADEQTMLLSFTGRQV